MGKRFIYLVRHAQTDRAAPSLDQLGNSLTDLGREQAELTARRLSALPIGIIHHSPLRRAAETAGIIAAAFPDAPLRPARLLQECIPYLPAAFIEWREAGGAHAAQEQTLPPELRQWQGVWPAAAERKLIEQGMHQAQRAFTKYFVPTHRVERHEIIVCHGNILRYFVCRALNVPADAWIQTDIHNCGISEIMIESSGRTLLLSHNDTGHLPYSMRTFM